MRRFFPSSNGIASRGESHGTLQPSDRSSAVEELENPAKRAGIPRKILSEWSRWEDTVRCSVEFICIHGFFQDCDVELAALLGARPTAMRHARVEAELITFAQHERLDHDKNQRSPGENSCDTRASVVQRASASFRTGSTKTRLSPSNTVNKSHQNNIPAQPQLCCGLESSYEKGPASFDAGPGIDQLSTARAAGLQSPAFAIFARDVFVKVRQVRADEIFRVPLDSLAFTSSHGKVADEDGFG